MFQSKISINGTEVKLKLNYYASETERDSEAERVQFSASCNVSRNDVVFSPFSVSPLSFAATPLGASSTSPQKDDAMGKPGTEKMAPSASASRTEANPRPQLAPNHRDPLAPEFRH